MADRAKKALIACLLLLVAGIAPNAFACDEPSEQRLEEFLKSEPGAEGSETDVMSAEQFDEEANFILQSIYSSQQAISRTVTLMSRRMDRMLGTTEEFPDDAYDSVLRLRFIQRVDEGGGGEFDASAGGKLSLPGTERRLSLVFLSDDYDDPLDRERRTDRELDPDEATRRSLSLQLFRPSRAWKASASMGLRSGEPIDLLTRLSVWRDFEPRRWLVRPGQSLFWYDERGFGGATELLVQHPLGESMLMRSDSGATWFERDEQFYYDQVFSLLQPIGVRRDLLWQVGLQAESEPNKHVTRYYAQVRWRSVVHRDWLVLELRPQVLREREDDFQTKLRLYFGFELLFGDPRHY